MRVRSAKFHIFFCLALALIAPTTTFAQQGDPGCWITRDGTDVLGHTPAYYDEALTRDWYQSLQMADAAVMAQVAGVYYTEIPAPQLGMISRQYRSYSANGGFEYKDQTCSATGCSENYGHGRWAAHGIGGNTIALMISWSDLIRTNACIGGQLQYDRAGLYGADGTRWQRVQ
ncbi:MAG: hypothetical protein KDJ88_15015 [Bauldia sp.]|nr:hypothetical protein [Bauldia sp.]